MRILVDYRPALRERSGVGEYVHEMVRALTTVSRPGRADEVVLFTASWKDRLAPDVVDELGVRAVDRRIPVSALTWAWNRLRWPPVEWLSGPVDLVHAATPLAIPSRAACVLTIHDLHFLRHPERMSGEMRRDFPALVRRHAQRAPAIVVSSAYTAADVERTLDVPSARVHVCAPGAPRWAPAIIERRRTEPRKHILFLGTLEPRKNLGVLLEAYERLRARGAAVPPLVVAGRPAAAAPEVARRADRGGLGGHVHLMGYVSDAVRRDLLAAAHMLVLPSLDEGFGLPVLEAMASGVPIVVSAGGALPEVAGPAAVPIDPANVDGFSAAMATLLDPAAASAASARGIARAGAYQWDTCARHVRQAWASALERHR